MDSRWRSPSPIRYQRPESRASVAEESEHPSRPESRASAFSYGLSDAFAANVEGESTLRPDMFNHRLLTVLQNICTSIEQKHVVT